MKTTYKYAALINVDYSDDYYSVSYASGIIWEPSEMKFVLTGFEENGKSGKSDEERDRICERLIYAAEDWFNKTGKKYLAAISSEKLAEAREYGYSYIAGKPLAKTKYFSGDCYIEISAEEI